VNLYDKYVIQIFKDRDVLLDDISCLIGKTNITYLYNFAIQHYCQFFSNLNDHIYYMGELNEHFKEKFSYLDDLKNLKFENENVIYKSINQSEDKHGSHKDQLDDYLLTQMSNHIIHLINVNSKKENDWEEDFNNLSIFDQENILSKKNQENFGERKKNHFENDSKFLKNGNNLNDSLVLNKSYNLSNTSFHNNSLAIIDRTAVKLSESLSVCQKLILIAAFCASELTQKFDTKIFKSVKNTGIKRRVIIRRTLFLI